MYFGGPCYEGWQICSNNQLRESAYLASGSTLIGCNRLSADLQLTKYLATAATVSTALVRCD